MTRPTASARYRHGRYCSYVLIHGLRWDCPSVDPLCNFLMKQRQPVARPWVEVFGGWCDVAAHSLVRLRGNGNVPQLDRLVLGESSFR